jgi:hypothetical protein
VVVCSRGGRRATHKGSRRCDPDQAVALVSALPMTFVVAWTMSLVQPGRFFTPQQLPALFWGRGRSTAGRYATTTHCAHADGAEAPRPCAGSPGTRSRGDSAAFPSALLEDCRRGSAAT